MDEFSSRDFRSMKLVTRVDDIYTETALQWTRYKFLMI